MKCEEKKVEGFNTKIISIGNITLGIATDIGPRILYIASEKRPKLNLFGVLPELGVQTPEGFWRIYGGHRLWSSPEMMPRSYSLDDKPVKIDVKDNSVTVSGNPEEGNFIQKEITIRPAANGGVEVVHAIRNIGRWPIRLACWALSVMRQSGFAIIPIKPSKVDKEGLLPDRHLSLWPYTDLSDERLVLDGECLFVRQNPKIERPFKIGATANPTWTAYWIDGVAFVKQFSEVAGDYPDYGCNVEVYTNAGMLELETVGPLKMLNPSEFTQHTETWKIFEIEGLAAKPKSIKKKLEALL